MAAPQETTPPGYWAWAPAGKPIRILLNLELVDRLLSTVIDGFGSVPKRGAEVGGILLGTRARSGDKLEVTVEDYLPVYCSHRFGPSYVLSDDDMGNFEAAVQGNGASVIGYYRSHTRDGLALGTEDLQYCQKYFSNADDIMLLVKPSAMKVSKAGFFYYQNGEIQDQTDLEFDFRRSELETGGAPARRPLGERRQPPPPSFDPPVARPPRPGEFPNPFQQQDPDPEPQYPIQPPLDPLPQDLQPYGQPRGLQLVNNQPPASQATGLAGAMAAAPNSQKMRRSWVWFPLSFIFLLLGVLLGFQSALTINAPKGTSQDAYSLNLGVERRQDDLSIRWDRSNQAIRTASKAVLEIQDGRYSKRVDLDSAQLQTGSVIYRFSTNDVRFRLDVYPRDRVVISEWIEWKGSK